MRIGNKLFPYPVLNNDSNLSEYQLNCSFSLEFEKDEEGKILIEKGNVVFKNVHFLLCCDYIKQLISNTKVKCAMVVECSASTYRKTYEIYSESENIMVPISSLKDTVAVSAYLYATDDILNFSSEDFSDDYRGYHFSIEKYDILAVDDGFKFDVNIEPSEDDKISSIFLISKYMSNEHVMKCESQKNKVVIYLPQQEFDAYWAIKSDPRYNNIVFSMIAIPALTNALQEVMDSLEENDINTIQELCEKVRWFEAVIKSYKREKNQELIFEELEDIKPFELAQIVLNKGTCKGIDDFKNMLLGNGMKGDTDDE